jgi:hypothetical protein
MWGLLAGGVVALGGIAYVMMGSKPKAAASAAVKANRRHRRVSRNTRRRVRRNTGDAFDTKLKHAWSLLNGGDIAGVKREIAELKRIAPTALEHQRVQLGGLIRSAMHHGKFLGSPYTGSSGHKSLPSKRSKKWLEMNRRAR